MALSVAGIRREKDTSSLTIGRIPSGSSRCTYSLSCSVVTYLDRRWRRHVWWGVLRRKEDCSRKKMAHDYKTDPFGEECRPKTVWFVVLVEAGLIVSEKSHRRHLRTPIALLAPCWSPVSSFRCRDDLP
eukprot:Blabericola_migrator_1__372@NODE_1093_length_5463_cov_81_535211_g748_i0_p6_GENE_NODE_1093_length_5463_cov_81_535211_g748_i0NODE_1093_length_5463_cov_81_535211_g748_i0_p6_ORF_typecomplete_len129_score2_15TMEM189_B_dmain/PF10520_9/0_026_NODE_1093_length_5463_cov_81_535211_g748_i0397783